MHRPEIRCRALALSASGRTDRQIAEALGIPRTTVRDLRGPKRLQALTEVCPRCWGRARPVSIDAAGYAELLGLYLGDGHILRIGRSWRLRLSLDAAYPLIIAESRDLLARTFPANRIGSVSRDSGSTRILTIDHNHLPCLFPQHGSGQKHARLIRLETWQSALVASAPWAFLRGCIRSDGCVFINRTGHYEYLSYDFANHSADILDLFEGTCNSVGVACRRYERHIRVYRRESVAALVAHVGLKA